MRRIFLSAVSVFALAASANAADMYRAPEPIGSYKDAPAAYVNWSGFYVGVNGGYGWGSNNELHSYGNAPVDFTSEGGFGGGQAGYNWQRDRIVFGIEADIQGAGIDGSATTSSGSASSNLDWFGTVRGRLGLTILDSGLLYATGGFAFGGVQDKVTSLAYPRARAM